MARAGVEHQTERIGAGVVGCNFSPEEALPKCWRNNAGWKDSVVRDVDMIMPSQRLPDAHSG